MRKKLLLFFVGLVSLSAFSGCEKTEYVDNMINPNKTYIRLIAPGDWVRLSNNAIKYDAVIPNLDEYYVDDNISVALSFDNEASYDILPAVIDGVAYSVNYTSGWVTVTAKGPLNEDYTINPPTSSVYMKVVISQSEYVED